MAQSYFYKENIVEPDWLVEAGFGAGWMNCLTDLGGKIGNRPRAMNWQGIRPAAAIFAIATYQQTIGFRVQYVRGSVGAADSLIGSGNAGSRYDRDLHFKSNITEITLMLEFYPFALSEGNISTCRLQLYVKGGVGWYRFNPQARIKNQWVNLQPLHTEGQGFSVADKLLQDSYSLDQLNLPVGIGMRWEAGPFMHLRLEGLYRILFTDYFDDVSTRYADPRQFALYLTPAHAALAVMASDRRRSGQPFQNSEIRGNPSKNDAFFHFQLSFSVLLNRKKDH